MSTVIARPYAQSRCAHLASGTPCAHERRLGRPAPCSVGRKWCPRLRLRRSGRRVQRTRPHRPGASGLAAPWARLEPYRVGLSLAPGQHAHGPSPSTGVSAHPMWATWYTWCTCNTCYHMISHVNPSCGRPHPLTRVALTIATGPLREAAILSLSGQVGGVFKLIHYRVSCNWRRCDSGRSILNRSRRVQIPGRVGLNNLLHPLARRRDRGLTGPHGVVQFEC